MKFWRFWMIGVLAGVGTLTASAKDLLDSQKGSVWSPDCRWLAFNPGSQNDLFIASMTGKRHFLIKPSGGIILDTSNVIAAGSKTPSLDTNPNQAAVKAASETNVVAIGSPGHDKLTFVEWSDNSDKFAYAYERKSRVIFSTQEQTILAQVSTTNALPWQSVDDLRVEFEYERSTPERPARYTLRVVRTGGQVVRQGTFESAKEITRLSQLRHTGSTFLTPDKTTLIYPRVSEKGWQLVLDSATVEGQRRPLTEPAEAAPFEWKLSSDGKYLAVVESATSLAIGPLHDWSKAERLPLSNATLSVQWSPDGRYLACLDRQSLSVIEVATEEPKLIGRSVHVTDSCNPQFWGWRGTQLFYNDISRRAADLNCYPVTTPEQARVFTGGKGWQSAPALRTVSPDGKLFACLISEMDGQGRFVSELWRLRLEPGANWELVRRFPPGQGS